MTPLDHFKHTNNSGHIWTQKHFNFHVMSLMNMSICSRYVLASMNAHANQWYLHFVGVETCHGDQIVAWWRSVIKFSFILHPYDVMRRTSWEDGLSIHVALVMILALGWWSINSNLLDSIIWWTRWTPNWAKSPMPWYLQKISTFFWYPGLFGSLQVSN